MFVWRCRVPHDSSQKSYSTPPTRTKQVRTICTNTGNTKTKFENNWPLALYYTKPNSLQKTPCFGKRPTERVFLVVLTDIDFWCRAFQRSQSNLKALKDEKLPLDCGKHKSVWKFFFLQLYIKMLFYSSDLRKKSELQVWISFLKTQHNYNNSGN